MNEIVSTIAGQLRELGVRPGEALLVHSSLKSLGPMDGGPESLIQGLLAALGAQGTLLMPALSYATVGKGKPIFDARLTPGCVGAIPEFFRRRDGTLRSIHPTHSVCGIGPAAAELLSHHAEGDTPGHARSPYSLFRDCDGQILMLGCGIEPNTSMHAVEELIEPPYLFAPERVQFTCIDADGNRSMTLQRVHDFKGYTQRYDRLAEVLKGPALRVGPVLAATAYLIECQAMWDVAENALRRDPFYFVERHT